MDLTTLAIEADLAGETHVLKLIERASQGSELAKRACQTWMRWALVRRELRLMRDAREAA